ncbi:hypothetical protein [Deinococcus arcticus]|uniref:Uncharacterized protein n=1 Tax=Deinococcus arcticus TaxID=2136176 RepID=A0A2T3W912_9DEIO|nr:hypothetical protein [Deinococcus arcticus]PTA68284.1 hypothetical protein C8263_07495 [Deinococcus arcticus]
MGGHLWWYVEPYEPDIAAVLERVQRREFQAGRYSPVIMFPDFPVTPDSPAPGPAHATREEAIEAADAEGTRTILDVPGLAQSPEDWGMHPLSNEQLEALFGTAQPTLEQIETCDELTDPIGRGESLYVVAYAAGQPTHLYFVGYSYD